MPSKHIVYMYIVVYGCMNITHHGSCLAHTVPGTEPHIVTRNNLKICKIVCAHL